MAKRNGVKDELRSALARRGYAREMKRLERSWHRNESEAKAKQSNVKIGNAKEKS